MNWRKLPLFCPNCGVQGIWQDADNAGDYYYAGTPMYCFACDRELSDIQVKNPDDARNGVQGRAFDMKRFEDARSGALAASPSDERPPATFNAWTTMTDEGRLAFLDAHPCCRGCGSLDTGCHCRNDD